MKTYKYVKGLFASYGKRRMSGKVMKIEMGHCPKFQGPCGTWTAQSAENAYYVVLSTSSEAPAVHATRSLMGV